MTPRPTPLWPTAALAALLGATALSGPTPLRAQPARPAVPAEEGVRWQDLSAPQRATLKPLESDWSHIDASRKQKWVEIAARYPSMPAAEQERVAARMNEWAKLSPAERGQARLNFQEARQLTPQERQVRWEAYQALPPEQRRELATRQSPPPRAATSRDGSQPKSNLVPNPAYAAPPQPVAPTVVQALPGATTSLISTRPAPPSHQQTGMPKISASPGFVDKATLLPQRGPQGAAARPVAAADDDAKKK